ncbi:hypothetical protein PMAYCL1PPCAC_04785, partial [Pristionchus mayeri]
AAADAFPQRFSDHFVQFLRNNPEHNAFALQAFELYKDAGTFGGIVDDESMEDEVQPRSRHDPVLFVHGNQESALSFSATATGWNRQIEYFLSKGYSMAKLHGLTHGHRNVSVALANRFTCEIIRGVRNHIEAVIHYSQASKIDVISHSMGVTIARAAIIGGTIKFSDGDCHLGKSIASKVDTFLGIAGAHYGVCYCAIAHLMSMNACSNDAFATGICRIGNDSDARMTDLAPVYCANPDVSCENNYSSVLKQINDRNERCGDFIVSTWSLKDEILGGTNLAWGKKTSHIPDSDLTIEYGDLTHLEIKDLTSRHQYELINAHDINVAAPVSR